MRLSTRLTAGFALACVGVLGSYGVLQLRAEREELQNAARREMRLVGNAVEVAISYALRDHQAADLQGILDTIEWSRSDVDVFVFDSHKKLTASSWGNRANLPLIPLVLDETLASQKPTVKFHGPGGLSFLLLALPLSAKGGVSPGAVVLIRQLDDVRNDLAATRQSLISTIAVLVITISGLGLLLGIVYVRRPLTAITRGMQVVQKGDLSARLSAQRSEELDELVSEFNIMVAALRDARERFAKEAEARQSLEEGLRRVDKLATVGQLSAGLAHEIGSPLQILNGRARALLSRAHSSEEVRRNAEILVAESERIAGIVEQLMRFARRMPVKLREIDLRPTAEAVVNLLELVVRRQGITLELYCEEELPRILADPNQIQQVLLNLFGNAVRATPPGGRVTLRVRASNMAITGDGETKIPAVRMTVEDSGVGMSPETLAKVFEPFFTTTAEDGGTGLGLAVVKGIVTEHGGTVSAESTRGEGSRFTVELPVQGPAWRHVRTS